MTKIGVVFGGQGSQYENMGKVFLNHSKTKYIYEEISEYKKIILNGDLEELSRTENLQPIMLAFQISALEFLKKNENIAATCGLSLGEYASLVLAGSLPYKDALSLVKIRGSLMQDESQKYDTKMLAILNKNEDEVKNLIINFSYPDEIHISNINSPKQVVVAGDTKKIDFFKEYMTERKIRAIEMKVSGAFHTSFMENAGKKYFEKLKEIKFEKPKIDYYLNLTGKKYSEEDLRIVLSKHIYNPVRLFDDIKNMIDSGVDKIVEIGPGSVISNIIRKNFKEVQVISLKNEEEIIKG
ncbi:ACP S-malonyltransferase [Anaerococcus sp. AGMB00486]|uniref:Malonyl CoA-acyl carrier protein transacylase n=2 Tax=Anaerococcus TaxID=165779 RepID=A0ABX2N9S6_9FIRM|nr:MULTISPECIES: ACP S-malonyltransferase [Anaerococcus]MSS78327.1 ACP S-malonyltransferase [Anaerococcus porci]NVF11441.1 ACP S-malonyltransferase [Anaerococcus faecalis]